MCFPQNCSNNVDKTNLHLILYITPNKNDIANGYVDYWIDNKKITQNFSVNKNDIVKIELPNYLQLDTFNIALKKGIIVHSDNPITLYGFSLQTYGSDAFLCYPINTLYTNYIVLSNENELTNGVVGNPNNSFSNITIVSKEDNTEIEINPSCPIQFPNVQKNEKFKIKLNAYETIQLIANVTNYYDVSGSLINSNKPIAVYSTHQRTAIPRNESIDVLIEQTPPIPALGNRYVFTPNFSYPGDYKSFGKIVAAFDKTELELPDSNVIINKGEYLTFQFDSAFYFKSTRPVLAGHLKPSCNQKKKIFNSDPFLAILASPQQWLKDYTIISASYSNFNIHFLNLSISKSEYSPITLDGKVLPDSIFKSVKGGDYLWARLENFNVGVHNLSCDVKFGIMAYGYGELDSYGYTGGMALEHLDYLNDSISPSFDIDKCKQSILIKDDTISIFSGIEILKVIEKENIDFTYKKILKGDTNYLINYTIPDDRAYSKLVLLVEDIAGRRDTLRLNLKPRTVFFQGIKNNILRDTLYYTQDSLVKIKINNNGFDDENIKLSLKQNISFSMPSSDIKSLI
ncbi:MAG: IgGFc-binding protein, partial [Candidatus Kapabacteria bacterium]|nr:IgGFc-binding protein [Candidatus Kapabacteria bacterium]